MKYEKKRQNEKTIITISVTVVLLVVVLSIGFILGPSMISSGNPQNTPAPSVTPTPLAGEPKFYDDALLQAVQSALGINTVPTADQMKELEILDCGDVEINELIGLEYAINLKDLTMKFAGVAIDPILDIQIEKLKIMSDTSVQPLLDDIRYMSYLKYLDLTDCGISIVGYLSELPVLETLILDDNRVSDLSNITKMASLKTLSLKNCNIKHINDFFNFITLERLYIDNNKIEDIAAIETMISLKECTYEGNPIKKDEDDKKE